MWTLLPESVVADLRALGSFRVADFEAGALAALSTAFGDLFGPLLGPAFWDEAMRRRDELLAPAAPMWA